jgi:hypothetical protein
LELSAAMSFGTMDAVLMNCECMASVGAATQLYVRLLRIWHRLCIGKIWS